MSHASSARHHNLVGAFALALSDRMAAAIEREAGLGPNGAAALLLVRHGHVRRIDDLRAPLGLTQAGVARLVERLVAARLVRRVAAADGDRRAVALALTGAGRAQATALLHTREHAIGELLAGLSPAQVEQLGAVAERVLSGAACEHSAPARLCRYCDEGACDLARCPVELAAAAGVGA